MNVRRPVPADTPEAAKHRYRMLRMATALSACVLATVVLVVIGLALWSSTRKTLDSAAISRTNSAKSQCDAKFAQAASDASREAIALLTDIDANNQKLLKAIVTVAPGDQRTTATADIVAAGDKLAARADAQQAVVRATSEARDKYLQDGRPLPCPLDP